MAATQKGMFVDTSICTGCKACQVACKDQNSLPVGLLWRLRKAGPHAPVAEESAAERRALVARGSVPHMKTLSLKKDSVSYMKTSISGQGATSKEQKGNSVPLLFLSLFLPYWNSSVSKVLLNALEFSFLFSPVKPREKLL